MYVAFILGFLSVILMCSLLAECQVKWWSLQFAHKRCELSSSKMFKVNKIAISRANIILRFAVSNDDCQANEPIETAACKWNEETKQCIKNKPLTASTNSELFQSLGQSFGRWMSELCATWRDHSTSHWKTAACTLQCNEFVWLVGVFFFLLLHRFVWCNVLFK